VRGVRGNVPGGHMGRVGRVVHRQVSGTEQVSGGRRTGLMQALVGQQAPSTAVAKQMKVLAGLEVTAKSVEHTAKAIGADIASGEQREVARRIRGAQRQDRRFAGPYA
jgi:hypothetical protein